MKINYLSDFDFIISLTDCFGESVGFPPAGVDWSITLQTRGATHSFTASCIEGVCSNCFNDKDRIHIVAKDHGLSPGHIVATMEILSPGDYYPEGTRRIVDRQELPIELVMSSGGCCCGSSDRIEVTIPEIGYSTLKAEINSLTKKLQDISSQITVITSTLNQITDSLEAIVKRMNTVPANSFFELEKAPAPSKIPIPDKIPE